MRIKLDPRQMHRMEIAGVLVFLALAAYAYVWANGPAATSTSTTPPPDSSVNTPSEQPLTTTLFSTNLPSDIVVRTKNETPHGNILMQLMAANRTGQVADQLGVTVGSLNGQALSDLSDVRLRATNTQAYKPTKEEWFPEGAVAYERADGLYEKSVFWSNGQGRYAAVVVSGTNDRRDYLDRLLETVIKNWSWK